MHKSVIGQTSKQRRNCEEQKKRRADIEKQFPKTVTFHTYEYIVQKIEIRTAQLSAIYEKLGIKLRKSELKSLAITSYIYISHNKHKMEQLKFIYEQLVEEKTSIKKLIFKLNKKFPEKREWNNEVLVDFVLFRG